MAKYIQFKRSPEIWLSNIFNWVDVLILVLIFFSAAFRITLHYFPEGRMTDVRALDFADWLNQVYGGDYGQLRPGQWAGESYDGIREARNAPTRTAPQRTHPRRARPQRTHPRRAPPQRAHPCRAPPQRAHPRRNPN
eukprot:6576036-Prymnesium_polylepis.1